MPNAAVCQFKIEEMENLENFEKFRRIFLNLFAVNTGLKVCWKLGVSLDGFKKKRPKSL